MEFIEWEPSVYVSRPALIREEKSVEDRCKLILCVFNRKNGKYDNLVGVESKRLSAERPCSKDLIEINKDR